MAEQPAKGIPDVVSLLCARRCMHISEPRGARRTAFASGASTQIDSGPFGARNFAQRRRKLFRPNCVSARAELLCIIHAPTNGEINLLTPSEFRTDNVLLSAKLSMRVIKY